MLLFFTFLSFINSQCIQQVGYFQAADLSCSACQKPYEDCSQGYFNNVISSSQVAIKCQDQYPFLTDLNSCFSQCPSGYYQEDTLYQCDACYPRQCQQCSSSGCLSCKDGQIFNPVDNSCSSNCGVKNQFGTQGSDCTDYCQNQVYYYESFQTMNCQQIEICPSYRFQENQDVSSPPSSDYIAHLFSAKKGKKNCIKKKQKNSLFLNFFVFQ